MAVETDFEYLRAMIGRGFVSGPVLEIGSRRWQDEAGTDTGNAEHVCQEAGIRWEGCDIVPGPGVDFCLDVLDEVAVSAIGRSWPTVLLFNLLEHVYDPASALENSMQLLENEGTCVVVTPAIWQLHNVPGDYWRPLPDFYLEFVRRHRYAIEADTMTWLTVQKLIPVASISRPDQMLLPSSHAAVQLFGARRAYWSRAVHKFANTSGRKMGFPTCGLGVVIRKRSSQAQS
jgi:hypothetical protein